MKTLLDEALDLLEDNEIVCEAGAYDNDYGCITCAGDVHHAVYPERWRVEHEDTCRWLLLMKKAGRRT